MRGNIKTGLIQTGCERVDWIHMAEGRVNWWTVLNTVTKILFPQTVGKFLTTWTTTTFSKRALLHEFG